MLSFQRLFSMSAFEGLRSIMLQRELQPTHGLDETISIIASTNPDSNSFDFEAAKILVNVVGEHVQPQGLIFYQHCIRSVILSYQPIWARLMTLGRKRFIKKLDRDEESIFREAGLLIDPPDDLVIQWWDNITGLIRLEADKLKLERAREAERLTLIFEANRMQKDGIIENPKWIAIEDNTAGYDVLSFVKNDYGLLNKLIEVKSTISSPLRFYLTRNEWDQALDFGDNYFFYIWNMQVNPPRLFIKTVTEIKPHVPNDNEKGKWKSAEIPIGV